MRRVLSSGVAALLAVGGLVAVSLPASAATFTPTPDPTVDGAAGSLRAAVVAATSVGGDEIDLQAGGTYTLTCAGGGRLTHADTPLIMSTRSGAPATIHQTCADNRALVQGTGLLTMNDVVMTGGCIGATGSVMVTNSMISGNTCIFIGSCNGATGSVTVTNSTNSGNTSISIGGGIGATGSVTVTNSTVSGNSRGALPRRRRCGDQHRSDQHHPTPGPGL